MLAIRTQKRGNWENKRKKKSKIPASLGKDFSTAMNAENKKAEKLKRTGICPAPAVLLGSEAALCTPVTVWAEGQEQKEIDGSGNKWHKTI